MVTVLLDDMQFLTQCSLYPLEIVFKKRKDQMFGRLLQELQTNIAFSQKEEILDLCQKLNKVRIIIVHKLARQVGFGEVRKQAETAKDIFDRIFNLFEAAHDHFRACLCDYQDKFLSDGLIAEVSYGTRPKGSRSKESQPED